MSDTLALPDNGVPLPEFLTRLREGRFVSPSGAESAFLFDTLKRAMAKKAVEHEIADSDDSVLQDMGAGGRGYPMEIYFVGENYDQAADKFFESLAERYTPDKPGILKHPRWGDIPVMPFSVDQAESFTSGGVGISRFTVEFRQTKSLSYPATTGVGIGSVRDSAAALRDQVESAAAFDVSSDAAYSRFREPTRGIVQGIAAGFRGLGDSISEYQAGIDSSVEGIYSALDGFEAPGTVLSQIGDLVYGVAEAITETPEKVNTFVEVSKAGIATYATEIENLVSSLDKRNAAQALQGVGALMCGASALAALNTDLSTREAVGDLMDSLVDLYATYQAGVDSAYGALDGPISKQYIPDHDTLSGLYGIFAATQQLLINRAFDLKTKRVKRLTAPSDALTRTWELYGDIDQLAFYCATNHITDDEFAEIPAGREEVAYV